jgi:hypothetical protein
MTRKHQACHHVLPSPDQPPVGARRGAGGEGMKDEVRKAMVLPSVHGPHPSPLPRGEGTKRRRGFLAVAVLISMAAASLILLLTLRTAADSRRVAQGQLQQAQAQWLVESGLERAAARLASDAQYQGETWSIPAEELGGSAAVVLIRVAPVAGEADSRAVFVEADYPNHPVDRARKTKEVLVKGTGNRE